MEHPRYVLYRLTHRLYDHFRENRATRLQIGILALVFAGLWWAIGVLAGTVLAFFVYFLTPDGPQRDWPAAYALAGTTLLCGVFGTWQAWKSYRRKVSELEIAAV